MNTRLFTTTVIWVDTLGELAEHHTRVFAKFEDALSHVENVEKEWIQMIENFSEESGIDSDLDCVEHLVSYDSLYKHYVYEDGKEKVFAIEGHDLELS